MMGYGTSLRRVAVFSTAIILLAVMMDPVVGGLQGITAQPSVMYRLNDPIASPLATGVVS